MGAHQSSSRDEPSNFSNASTTVKKTCYYELLAIDTQANDEE